MPVFRRTCNKKSAGLHLPYRLGEPQNRLRKGVSVLTPEPEADSTDVGKLAACAQRAGEAHRQKPHALFVQRVPTIGRDALFCFSGASRAAYGG